MTFDSLFNPIINAEGEVAFRGSVEGPAGPESGIWLSSRLAPRIQMAAKENSPTPQFFFQGDGPTGAMFASAPGQASFGSLKLDFGRYVNFQARFRGGDATTDTDTAVYHAYSGPDRVNVSGLLREGRLLRSDFLRGTNDMGRIGDLLEVQGSMQETARRQFLVVGASPNTDAAFEVPPSAYSLHYPREGIPLRPSGFQAVLGDVRDSRPLTARQSSDVTFRAGVTSTTSPHINGDAILIDRFGALLEPPEIISWKGLSPRNAPDLTFDSFYHPATGLSAVFYAVRLAGSGVESKSDSGIVIQQAFDDPVLLLQEGMPVSTGPGIVLGELGTDNMVGSSNRVTFNNQLVGAGITAENDWALVVGSLLRNVRTASVLAQEGQHVIGLPLGSTLAGLDEAHFQMNLPGDAIFNAQFAGPNGNGVGLFYASLEQPEPSLLVRTGQEFDIGGGVFRTISGIGLMEMSNPWDGRASQLNDDGQIAFSLTFTDGSQGVFAAVVPEPGTIVLGCIGGVLMIAAVWRRRRIPA